MNISLDKKIIIFGTGELAKKITEELQTENFKISYYIDNKEEKQDRFFLNRPINNPNFLLDEDKSCLFIIIASMYYEEISKQLESMGFESDKHFKEYFEFIYGGKNYFCPFCKGSFNHFLPKGWETRVAKEKQIIGSGYRENVVCPRCQSYDRERLILLYLQEETNVFNDNYNILHIAPEKNLEKALKALNISGYLTADLSSDKVMQKMDITDIQYNDNYFDVIICNHVLEHIPNDKKALKELYRVLNLKGFAILQVPISQTLNETYEDSNITNYEERLEKFGQGDHVRIYGKDYIQRLEAAGFKVDLYDYRTKHGLDLFEKYRLLDDEILYICRKIM